MGEKMSVDIVNKVFEITEAPTLVDGEYQLAFDIEVDLYSDGKEDWKTSQSLRRRKFPLSAVGGNPTVGSKELGSTYFIDSDWKIKLYETNHRFLLNGNFYSKDGKSPFLMPDGYSVLLEQQVSSLTDSTTQQLPEIEGMSFGGVVSVDITSSYSGTAYPVGNMEYPVNNLADAVDIATERGFAILSIRGDITIGNAVDIDGYIVEGQNPTLTNIIVESSASVYECEFRNAKISGTLDGDSEITNCIVDGLEYVSGRIKRCGITEEPIILGGNTEALLIDCWSEVAGDSTPTINAGGSGQALAVRGYKGGFKLINRTGIDPVSIDFESGQFVADSTITNGVIYVRGTVGKLTINCDEALIDTYGVTNPRTIAETTMSYTRP